MGVNAIGRWLPAVSLFVYFGWNLPSVYSQESNKHQLDTIIIERHNVFDEDNPQELTWIGRVTNSLHMKTKESIIRSELLFHSGEPLNMQLVEESERNLRAMGIVGDVHIRIDTMAGGKTCATVETHDKWTLSLFTSYKQDGGHRIISAGVDESNFLGYAQGFTIHLTYKSEYADPYGLELRYYHRNFITDHVSLQVQLKNSDDYHLQTISLERTFFSDEVEWAGGIYADHGSKKRRQYQNGTEIASENISQQTASGWAAASLGNQFKIRPGLGFVHTNASSPDSFMQSTDHVDMALFSTQCVYRTWIKEYFLDNFGRIEDVPIGYTSSVCFGTNLNREHPSNAAYYSGIQARAAWAVPDLFYFSPEFLAKKYFLINGGSVSTVQWNLNAYSGSFGRNRLFIHGQSIIGSHWSTGMQVLLGSTTGLRGYPANQITGQRSLLVNIEDRFNLNMEWWIFRIGGVAFFDSGTAWQQGQSFSDQRMHSSVGFGLRIENTKQQGSGILRIEAAYSLDQFHFSQITITTQQPFDSFAGLDYIPSIIF
jgi:outer membrane protein assembly factor BamA